MKTTLCTLYNSLYLDKGLVLYDSLKECAKDFELYVLCMDEKCFEILSNIGEERLKPIPLANVENEDMLEAKSNRTDAEYCWTCTSRLIDFILETFKPECCTYIDADMYFYHDPQILVDEMLASGASVMMVPHRFNERNKHLAAKVGTYCVEFNTFRNNKEGLQVLRHWYNNCLKCCSNLGDGIHWGDQKYMDEWQILFPDSVHVCEHPGAGVAPWNIECYECNGNKLGTILYKNSVDPIPVVFWHYQSIRYITQKRVKTGIKARNRNIDYRLVHLFYGDYLQRIDSKSTYLKSKYDVGRRIFEHPAVNKKSKKNKFLVGRLLHKYLPDYFRHDYIIYI